VSDRLSVWFRRITRTIHVGLVVVGFAVVVLFISCFTSYPWKLYKKLCYDEAVLDGPPEYIVVLGGGGIPSESGLVRSYHGVQVARAFPDAKVILSLPADGPLETSELGQMRKEFILRGIDEKRVLLEDKGRNTRAQAMGVLDLLGEECLEQPFVVVTSPDHTLRSLGVFRKLGFKQVVQSAAFPETVKTDMTFKPKDLGAKPFVPDIGRRLNLRYTFWVNINYLSIFTREGVAVAYYRLCGWI
jgi:uncharacterized SAM-binding protein YcdF (DUF218 family)